MSQNTPRKTTVENQPLIAARERGLRSSRAYRVEKLASIQGLTFYNDSAAVSLEMVAESMSGFENPVIWITDTFCNCKDLEALGKLANQYARVVIAVGPDGNEIFEAIRPFNHLFIPVTTWQEAIETALSSTAFAKVALFSPGCPASEPFADFKERGAHFAKLVEYYSESLKL